MKKKFGIELGICLSSVRSILDIRKSRSKCRNSPAFVLYLNMHSVMKHSAIKCC